MTRARWFALLVTFNAAGLVTAGSAAAHDDPGGSPKGEAAPPDTVASESEPGKEEEKEPEPGWEVNLDFVGGATTTSVLTEGVPSRGVPPANVFDSTRVSAYTFLAGIERHLGERFTLGARLPFGWADLSSRSGIGEARSATFAGNLELEAAFVLAHGSTWNVVGTFEVALPTAGGTEAPSPEEVEADRARRFEYKSYDTFAAVHSGAAVRGAYESALFEPGNLGLVPKLGANFRFSKLTLSPMVKLENLFDVTGDAEEIYINELVVGVRAGYRVTPVFEPGLHLWVRELHEHSHTDDSFSTVTVAEPYARFHAGAIKPTVSVILPLTGDLADAKTFGIRAGFVAEL